MVQEAGDEPHKKLSKPRAEEDQVMVDAEANLVEKEAEHTAEEEAKEPLENIEGSAAEDEELYGDDEEYADDEYLEDLSEEVMEHLEKERNEEMAKFENELKVGKLKVKFGDFDEVNAMVVTLPLFFEARRDQPNFMDGDVFNEVESMVQMEGAREVEVAREILKEGNAQPCIMVPKKKEKVPEKVCYDMPTKKMSSHFKPLNVGAHFDGVPVSKVLMDMGATVNILLASIMRKLKKGSDELIPTETTVSGFVGDTMTSKGILPLQVRVGQKVRMIAFFVVETTAHFNALLGRDWIHGSMCVPSSLHQFLQFWHKDGSVEIVQADVRPFMASANVVEVKFYEDDIGPLYFTGDTNIEEEKKAAVEDTLRRLYGFEPKERPSEMDDSEDDALEFEEVELAPSEMDDSKAEVQDPLLEINLGMEDNHRPIYISGLMEPELRNKMEELLREFKDCFTWDYTEMPGLSRDLVDHRLPTVEDFKPFKQPPRQMSAEVELQVKEEIVRLVKAKFIRLARYVELLSNIVPVRKKKREQ
ncbi:unnamed protein product [Prunus brigantina]